MGKNSGVGAKFGQCTCSTSVIEMNMGNDDVVNVFRGKALIFERFHERRDALVGIIVDEGSMLTIGHQVGRCVVRPLHIIAINGSNRVKVV